MHEIETWIEEAAAAESIPIRKLPEAEAMVVQREAMSRYVTIDDPRVWWVNLARPVDEYYDRNETSLLSILPAKEGLCWLIPETSKPDLPVYEIDVRMIQKLIEDCFGFEYNIVAKDFSWLVIETDHDQYYVCRDTDVLPSL